MKVRPSKLNNKAVDNYTLYAAMGHPQHDENDDYDH